MVSISPLLERMHPVRFYTGGVLDLRRRVRPVLAMTMLVLSHGFIVANQAEVMEAQGEPETHGDRIPEFEAAVHVSHSFAEEAVRIGLTVSPDEVSRRMTAYRTLYPGKWIEPSKVERIVLAEKYWESKGMTVDDEEAAKAFSKNGDPSRFATPEAAEEARKAVRTQIMANRESTRREGAKLDDLAQIRILEVVRPKAEWGTHELRIESHPDECVAWSGADCYVTVQEYNAACPHFRIPAVMGQDSARNEMLRRYLLVKRRADLARQSGMEGNVDSIINSIRMSKDEDKWMRSARKYGHPASDYAVLEAAYGRYYSRYFAPRRESYYAVIGSSDSIKVDSLYQVYSAWRNAVESDAGGNPAHIKEPRLPWSYPGPAELPEAWVRTGRDLQVGRACKPFRAGFGYFFLRLEKIARKPEIPIQKAFAQLAYLTARDKFLDMDSVSEAAARRFFSENKSRYAIPDTMTLRAWLIPGPARHPFRSLNGKRKPSALDDTAAFMPITISSLALPTETRIRLQEEIRKDSAKTFAGPLRDSYGTWYFSVHSRRPGKGETPFRLVRADILERISAPIAGSDQGQAVGAADDAVMLNIGLSNGFLRRPILESGQDPGQADRGAGSPAEEMARMQERLEKYRREEEGLLSGIRSNLASFLP